jgi:dCMP deaminase
MTREEKWDKRFYELALHVSTWSRDPTTKVGAVLVGKDRRKIALGYNGFPPGVEDFPDRLSNREVKHKLTQHAERNVLDNSAFDTEGSTLYITFFPCSECSKSAVSKGVKRVVSPPPSTNEPWASDAEWSLRILSEAGVQVDRFPKDE